MPSQRITINLGPTDIFKEESHFHLTIILGILGNMGVLKQEMLNNFYVIGELALDGTLRHTNSVLPSSLHYAEKKCGIICLFVNGKEIVWSGEKHQYLL